MRDAPGSAYPLMALSHLLNVLRSNTGLIQYSIFLVQQEEGPRSKDDTAFIVEKRGEPRLGHAASDPLSLVGGDRIGG